METINETFERLCAEAEAQEPADNDVSSSEAAAIIDGVPLDDLNPHPHDALFVDELDPDATEDDEASEEDDEASEEDEVAESLRPSTRLLRHGKPLSSVRLGPGEDGRMATSSTTRSGAYTSRFMAAGAAREVAARSVMVPPPDGRPSPKPQPMYHHFEAGLTDDDRSVHSIRAADRSDAEAKAAAAGLPGGARHIGSGNIPAARSNNREHNYGPAPRGYHVHEEIDEGRVLSLEVRQKMANRLRQMAPRMARMRELMRGRMATPKKLMYRARKAALMILRRKAAGRRATQYHDLPRAERIMIDRQLMTRFGKGLSRRITQLARLVLPAVRKKEEARLREIRGGSSADSAVMVSSAAAGGIGAVVEYTTPAGDKASGTVMWVSIDERVIAVAPEPHSPRVSWIKISVAETTDSSTDSGDAHPIYQMRKVVALRGKYQVRFDDGSRRSVDIDTARRVIAHHDSIRSGPARQKLAADLISSGDAFDAHVRRLGGGS